MYLPILHLPRVELHCKLQEKLHRVTGPLENIKFQFVRKLRVYGAGSFRI